MTAALFFAFFLFSLTASFWSSFVVKDYGAEMMGGELVLGIIITILFLLSLFVFVACIYEEIEKKKTKGLECDVSFLEGLPDFKIEQSLHLTLDIKSRVILFGRLKESQVRLRFQQITKLNYICWEGNISRWVPGSSGFSYPGLLKGTRVYVRPTSGYTKHEKLTVDGALEIQYKDKNGFPARIVLKIGQDDDYVDKWLESLCRCTMLSAPQYIPPVKPEKPGPKYL